MGHVFSPEIWVSLLTLTVLEVVLGIDNLIFLGIIADRLPPAQQIVGRVSLDPQSLTDRFNNH